MRVGLLVAALLTQFAHAQPLEIDRELEEAKALYREAKFAQAIAKLDRVVGRLEQMRDLQARRIQLSDAHLHLALSYVALNDPTAAKESLKQMLRADRNRKLDPDVYAPKVIELFEEAKKEVAVEPAAAAPPPPSATAKKGGSKAPLILLGAAAAAGGGLALAKGGGGTTGATPAATPTALPMPTVSGSNDIVFLGSNPPPGSTISVSTGTLRISVAYTLADRDAAMMFVGPVFSTAPGERGFCASFGTNVRRGSAMVEGQVTFAMPGTVDPRCRPPVDLPGVYAQFLDPADPSGRFFFEKIFSVTYRLVP